MLHCICLYRYGAKRKTARMLLFVHLLSISKSSFCKIHHNSNTSFAYMYMYMYLLNVCHAQVIDCAAFCVTLYLFVQVWGQKKDSQDASFLLLSTLSLSPKPAFVKSTTTLKIQCTPSFAYMYMYMYVLSVCHAQVI